MRGVGIESCQRHEREASVISSGASREKKFIGSMLFTVVPWIGRAKASIFWIARPGGGKIFAPILVGMRNSFFPAHLTTGGMSPHFLPSETHLDLINSVSVDIFSARGDEWLTVMQHNFSSVLTWYQHIFYDFPATWP